MNSVLSHADRRFVLTLVALAAGLAATALWPHKAQGAALFALVSLVKVSPMVALGILLSAWVAASGAGAVTANLFKGRPSSVVVTAAAIGAVTPVCGVTVLPLMTGLLVSGVPLAPIMAFWLSSPVTDPSLFTATWAVLGPGFAIGKTLAAFAIGIFAGLATALLHETRMVRVPLRAQPRGAENSGCTPATGGFVPAVWRDPVRMRTFARELAWMTKLVLLCLSLAFAAEYLLRDLVPPELLSAYAGADSPYAVPLAVTLGAPLYLDGYAALPLVRGLLDLGMSPGAALGFLVAGSAVSIWGVLAVVPVLRASTLVLFVALAVAGSLVSAYAFQALWHFLA